MYNSENKVEENMGLVHKPKVNRNEESKEKRNRGEPRYVFLQSIRGNQGENSET